MPEGRRARWIYRLGLGLHPALLAGAALSSMAATALAQGPVLSVQPGNTMRKLAGNGALGYSGDAAAAASATLAAPAAVAYDGAGNLYIADSGNNAVRKVDASGTMTTVAGSGLEGFAGDNGPAASALLDTPTGIAVDASNNLYIADSHNQRIRMVNAQGVISTIAGNGAAEFSGDNGPATSAGLFLPEAIAVDAAGNLYIADTGNHRIRKVSQGMVSTVAGDGEQIYSGDGGAAIAAGLDSPTSVAVDANNNLYIADSHNQRIRMVNVQGVIGTVAGNGSRGYSGDSGSAAQARLAAPTGVAVDGAGNIYIADSGNNVIREVGNGVIDTIAGNGQQGFAGDNGAALSAALDTPRSAALDMFGNLAIADSFNQRIRAMELPELVFTAQPAGSIGGPQSVTLLNTGSVLLAVQSVSFTGSFGLADGGTCAAPIALSPGSSCTVQIAFAPVAAAPVTGSVVFNGAGITPQVLLLSGIGSLSTTATTLIAAPASVAAGGSVTLTATVNGGGNPVTTGTVSFYNGSALLGAGALNAGGVAALTTNLLPAGADILTASYGGSNSHEASASLPVTVTVTEGPANPPSFTLAVTPASMSITQGGTGKATLLLTPAGGWSGTVTFQCSSIPANGACMFARNPVQLSGDNQPVSVGLVIQTGARQARITAALKPTQSPLNPIPLALAFWWPGSMAGVAAFAGKRKLSRRSQRWLQICLLLAASGALAAGLPGCGGGGSPAPKATPAVPLNVTVTATAASAAPVTTESATLTIEIAQ